MAATAEMIPVGTMPPSLLATLLEVKTDLRLSPAPGQPTTATHGSDARRSLSTTTDGMQPCPLLSSTARHHRFVNQGLDARRPLSTTDQSVAPTLPASSTRQTSTGLITVFKLSGVPFFATIVRRAPEYHVSRPADRTFLGLQNNTVGSFLLATDVHVTSDDHESRPADQCSPVTHRTHVGRPNRRPMEHRHPRRTCRRLFSVTTSDLEPISFMSPTPGRSKGDHHTPSARRSLSATGQPSLTALDVSPTPDRTSIGTHRCNVGRELATTEVMRPVQHLSPTPQEFRRP